MKFIVHLMFVAKIMALAAPANAGQAVQIFACQLDDEMTEENLEEKASKWLAAAKSVKGGENLRAFLHHPVAAKMDKGDMMFLLVAP